MNEWIHPKALDMVFVSYDEPDADRNFERIAAHWPKTRRVHGIKGFETAVRTAARMARTDHFMTIDGDTVAIEPAALNEPIELLPERRNCVLSFAARNRLNDLKYCDGGIKIWPRHIALNMLTHEDEEDRQDSTEFWRALCWYRLDRMVSEFDVTATPFHAFRAGFREGAKLASPDGIPARQAFPDLPLREAFARHVWPGNIDRLSVWCSVGADIEHGLFAIYGARLGAAMVHFDDWDPRSINDYDEFERWWRDVIVERLALGTDHPRRILHEIRREGERLRRGLGLRIADLDAEGSKFYKFVRAPAEQPGPAQGPGFVRSPNRDDSAIGPV